MSDSAMLIPENDFGVTEQGPEKMLLPYHTNYMFRRVS